MKIACVSDLHGNLVTYPSSFWEGLDQCEILFICGDILPLQIQSTILDSENWLLTEFRRWAENLPVEKVYFVAGNHDYWFERNPMMATIMFPKHSKVAYLRNEDVDYLSSQDGNIYKIFGTPYCHQFGNWPFMRTEDRLREHFQVIPEGVDILFSHDAPYGTSDICLEGWAADGQHKGCKALAEAIVEKKPRYCFHGHLHSTNHNKELLNNTEVYNTSILDEGYDIQYPPLILEICK